MTPKICECGQEMYFDWGYPDTQHEPGQSPAWYCSGAEGCGSEIKATQEEVRAKFEEEEQAFDIGG